MFFSPFFLGYPQHVRDRLSDLPLFQNLQMARLCDLAGRKFLLAWFLLVNDDKKNVQLSLSLPCLTNE